MVNAVDAAMRGYQVTVIDDACAAFSQDLHDAALRAHSIYTVASSETASPCWSNELVDEARAAKLCTGEAASFAWKTRLFNVIVNGSH